MVRRAQLARSLGRLLLGVALLVAQLGPFPPVGAAGAVALAVEEAPISEATTIAQPAAALPGSTAVKTTGDAELAGPKTAIVAAPGDRLRTITVNPAPVCSPLLSVGVAFDGAELLVSCVYGNVITRVDPATGANLGSITVSNIPTGEGIGAMSWDVQGNQLWVGTGRVSPHKVYTVVLDKGTGTGVATLRFTHSLGGYTIVDGLSYDQTDGTIWFSPDVHNRVYHYTTTGTLLGSFPVSLGGYGNSGIAVADSQTLYLSNNGGNQVYSAKKDGSQTTLFATVSSRVEDLECDNLTFAPQSVVWTKETYNFELNAFEVAPGQCLQSTTIISPAPVGADNFSPDDPDGSFSPDPVHTLTGNFAYTHTDLAIAGRGPSPAFGRAYNSGDTRIGPLGPGWTHGYAVRLNDPGDGTLDLILVGPQGRSDRYAPTGGGSYAAPPGVIATLARNPDGTYTAAHPDQTKWTFRSDGRLTAIADRHGNQSTLSYNPSGQLVSVSDPAGRGNLTLAYDPTSGRLTSVSDWLSPARSVQYQYDGQGRLWKVVDREGQTTTYGYDGTTSRLTTIADARGNVAVTMTYDAQGRVATQKDAKGLITGQQTTFAYVTNGDGTKTTTVTIPATSLDPAWHPQQIDSYDAQGRVTRHVFKPTANPADDVVEEYAYDASGFRASVRDGRANTTHFCYDVDYSGQPIPGSRGNLTRRIDPPPSPGANRPVTLYQYDAKQNLIQTIPPKGVASGTTVDCATSLSASLNTLYATDLAYDQATQTRLESITGRYVDPELGPQAAVTTFEYADPANPGLVTKILPPRGNALSDDGYATTFAYFGPGPKAGLLERVTRPSWHIGS